MLGHFTTRQQHWVVGFLHLALFFFPPFSLTAVLPPCEIKKEKKKAITQHITMPWSRWETMPHTCTVSNSFGLAFFKSISHYFCWRNPLEYPCGHWRNSSKNLLASKQLLFGFLFSSVFLASLPLELKNGSRGEERSRFQQFISPPTDVSRWPGERRPLTEGQRDTCERQNLTPANAQTHRNAYTHTAVRRIVRLRSAVSSQHWWNVWLAASRALETWCHSNKTPSFQREMAFYVFGATLWNARGEQRHGAEKDIKDERKQEKARGRATRLFSELVINRKAGLMTVVTSH